jgi:hypothetical protein
VIPTLGDAHVLDVTLDDDDDVIGVDEDPMMRTAPLGMVSGAVVGVLTVLSSVGLTRIGFSPRPFW